MEQEGKPAPVQTDDERLHEAAKRQAENLQGFFTHSGLNFPWSASGARLAATGGLMKRTICIVGVFAALSLAACTSGSGSTGGTTSVPAPTVSSSPSPSTDGEEATFTSTNPAYSFQYPSFWTKTTEFPASWAEKADPSVIYPAIFTFGHTTDTMGVVALTLQRVPPGTTLQASKEWDQQHVGHGYTLLWKRIPARMGGQRAYVMEYTNVVKGTTMKWARFVTINGGYLYAFEYAAPEAFDSGYLLVSFVAKSLTFGG